MMCIEKVLQLDQTYGMYLPQQVVCIATELCQYIQVRLTLSVFPQHRQCFDEYLRNGPNTKFDNYLLTWRWY